MNPFLLFWLMLKASLLSTSGTGNLPQLHDDLTAMGWASEQEFAEALAVGQITPGPSGLWVISLGYLVDGPRGALLAAVAISLPPLAVLLLARIYRRVGHHPATQGFVRGLSLAVNGVFLVVLAGLFAANGADLVAVAIVAGSVALGLARRVPVILTLAIAAAVGVALYGGW
jgi:chromate transporter